MATRKPKSPLPASASSTNPASAPSTAARRPASGPPAAPTDVVGSMLATVSGPSSAGLAAGDEQKFETEPQRRLASQKLGADAMGMALPDNPLKAVDYGHESALAPKTGASTTPPNEIDTASTVTEDTASGKVGDGVPKAGYNPAAESLDRVRVDSGGQTLTTSLGVKIADNQNSLKAGLRGPVLLEDFVLRDKITHFDHERIPERVVHARGSAAHGYFECYQPLTDITKAAPFTEAGKRTPVFVRFSTVLGERGAADLTRDVRGFAVKLYTDEGNWDLVGNNIPIFFIQDAMKFPDLVHAAKPEPHNQMPQGASAHDTFWDFAGLSPEITHMLMWAMSDRAIPRSYRMMQGFGVHTFRLVNAAGESVFCKFHWTPTAGTHSVTWDEAVKINGADSDFHRRDLWEAIEAGVYPEWELALQVFTEEQAESFTFDVLDCTKIVPEELVPLRPVGRMVLNRNPDNFFAETEQVAFCTQHVVPGIDFTNDPMLLGRNFSYHDTQLSRLGGPNFNQIPINAPVVEVHNNQRDGFQRQAIPRGRVAYEPNSLAGGCPFQAGVTTGFVPFPQPIPDAQKLRGKPEKFADHYTQATLFWRSQTAVEQQHIIAAFRFELTRVQTPAIRERILSLLVNVDENLALGVADGLGMALPAGQQRALPNPPKPEVESSAGLSLFARPGDGSIGARRVALLVCDGVDALSLRAAHTALAQAGAAPRFLGARLGQVMAASGEPIHVEATLESMPSVLWDAVVLPDGDAAQAALAGLGMAVEFVKDQYRHCKPMLVLGSATTLLEAANASAQLPDGSADPGIVVAPPVEPDAAEPLGGVTSAIQAFIGALGKHRHFEREVDPPPV
ncbi:MAG: catalase [Methylibium sp.]|nr:catalase [Methylibium sp.]